MFEINNLYENSNIEIMDEAGCFQIIRHIEDKSAGSQAQNKYFMREMEVCPKQVIARLNGNTVVTQAGAMQWMLGNIEMTSGIKGVGDLIGKALTSKATKESTVKPEYTGQGILMLEPTYKHLFLINVGAWGSIVLEDGMFMACDKSLSIKAITRKNVSSAVLGGEGLVNLCVSGKGILVCESRYPYSELYEIELSNDTIKIDGNMAMAWSDSLEFTVEKAGKSLVSSAASGEGFVNVYRGTGKILLCPLDGRFQ